MKFFVKCDFCTSEFETNALLVAHEKTHQSNQYSCKYCKKVFHEEDTLNKHLKEHTSAQWNCMDCSFQGNCESDLMKHLKITSHQPSHTVEDKRKIFQDYKQCYTCKMDFDGFFNLMNHRKIVHPSNKKCRNFPGSCTFDKDC